mmetsp:Transcript_19332/g.28447  ORF Transcript_19332/g.28447 Transcript_19332/m.28447 type:complete len:81 (-) Transcript_19332:60-302(-)
MSLSILRTPNISLNRIGSILCTVELVSGCRAIAIPILSLVTSTDMIALRYFFQSKIPATLEGPVKNRARLVAMMDDEKHT